MKNSSQCLNDRTDPFDCPFDASTMKYYNGASRPVRFTQVDNGVAVTGFVIDPYSAGIFCYWRTQRRIQNGRSTSVKDGKVEAVNPPGWALSRINSRGFNYVERVCNEVDP